MIRIESFGHAGSFRLFLRFSDAASGTLDLSPHIPGAGAYRNLLEENYFRRARLESSGTMLVWPNGAGFDAASLRSWLDAKKPGPDFWDEPTIETEARS
ncbi:MAG: hypothetical protein GMKNLPBB_02708 [Myxococcota bacterium]|nr:hypothetical protein [Myxococcota bacterium]